MQKFPIPEKDLYKPKRDHILFVSRRFVKLLQNKKLLNLFFDRMKELKVDYISADKFFDMNGTNDLERMKYGNIQLVLHGDKEMLYEMVHEFYDRSEGHDVKTWVH